MSACPSPRAPGSLPSPHPPHTGPARAPPVTLRAAAPAGRRGWASLPGTGVGVGVGAALLAACSVPSRRQTAREGSVGGRAPRSVFLPPRITPWQWGLACFWASRCCSPHTPAPAGPTQRDPLGMTKPQKQRRALKRHREESHLLTCSFNRGILKKK